jgi:hypothetical protein
LHISDEAARFVFLEAPKLFLHIHLLDCAA